MKTLTLLSILAAVAFATQSQAQTVAPAAGISPTPAMNGYAAVPEPTRGLLMIAGAVGVLMRRRRQSAL